MRRDTDVFILDDTNEDFILDRVEGLLVKGGICIIPTDTIYGIVTPDNFPSSVREIYKIKERPFDKPVIRLIGCFDNIKSYTNQNLPPVLKKYWPGPLTIIFKGIHEDKVSIRFPLYPFLNKIFHKLNYKVIVAPSANISGDENIYENNELVETFHGKVDMIVCLKDGLKDNRASTIIDISEPGWRIVRQGSLKVDVDRL